jgi:hypothetical protein
MSKSNSEDYFEMVEDPAQDTNVANRFINYLDTVSVSGKRIVFSEDPYGKKVIATYHWFKGDLLEPILGIISAITASRTVHKFFISLKKVPIEDAVE